MNIPTRFKILSILHEGKSAIVYLVLDITDDQKKVVKMTKDVNSNNFDNEILILKYILQWKSEYFIRYLCKIIDPETYVLSTDYVLHNTQKLTDSIDREDLTESTKFNSPLTLGFVYTYIPDSSSILYSVNYMRCNPSILKSVLDQVLQGLQILHQHHIVHRDIKLENILYNRYTNKITIIDFGSASLFSDDLHLAINTTPNITGTICNLSPEIEYASLKDNSILYLSDIWATGASFYYLLTGKYIIDDKKYSTVTQINNYFNSVEYRQVQEHIKNLRIISQIEPKTGDKICSVIRLCLTHLYSPRLNSEQIRQRLI